MTEGADAGDPSRPGKRERPDHRFVFKSIFEQNLPKNAAEPRFLPPEEMGEEFSFDSDDLADVPAGASAWDLATRYHEFKARPGFKRDPARQARLRRVSAEAVISRARKVLGSMVRPQTQRVVPLSELRADEAWSAADEIDVETSVEEREIWVEHRSPRSQPIVLCVDTSLSMTGDKLALTAVALAVVCLEFPEDPIGVIAFENEARVLVEPEGRRRELRRLIERFLDVPAQGYTHLEDGVKAALVMQDALARTPGSRPPSVVLLTDGKYTAGRDPEYLGNRFKNLHVLKMGNEVSGLGLCRDLARAGRGTVREVSRLEDLPRAMYSVVKQLLRGRVASR